MKVATLLSVPLLLAVALILAPGGEGSPRMAPDAPVTFTNVTALSGIDLRSRYTWGQAWGDYDNDGYADLFVGHHESTPALYHNNGNGTFTKMTKRAGMGGTFKLDRHACAWGDYNADRFLDLYCQTGARVAGDDSDPNQLFRNNRDGTFTDVAVELGVDDGPGGGRTVNWLDYNGDQHLDLYLANHRRVDMPEAFPSRLFRGLSGTFVDVSVEAGVTDIVRMNKGGSSWADYDEDDDPDLLKAADRGLILHRNRGDGTFTANSAAQAGLSGVENRSGAWGDYNNDGLLDLFIAGEGPEVLYKNNGDGTFGDVTASSGIPQSKAQGATWGDYDNDGDLDLFVVNHYDIELAQNSPDSLFINNGDGTFIDHALAAGVTGPTTGAGESAAWADYNKDGFLDLFVTNGERQGRKLVVPPGPSILYRSNGNGNHWLELKLRGSTNNTFGYGAKVSITVGGKTQFRQLTDGVVHHAQSDQLVHFGLGNATSVEEISIRWPNGDVQALTNVSADQVLTVTQP